LTADFDTGNVTLPAAGAEGDIEREVISPAP
jgi:hypothetical protein